jgi:hypothetical protein
MDGSYRDPLMRHVRPLLVAGALVLAVHQLFALAITVDHRIPPVAETIKDDRAAITARTASARAVVAPVTPRWREIRHAVALLAFVAALLAGLLFRAPRQRALASLEPRLRLHGPPRAIRRGPPPIHVTV